MQPTLSPGDIVLLRRRCARTGDIVVVRHPRLGRIVKRVREGGLLTGDNPADSTDAERLGRLVDSELIGVAVLAIMPSGLRRLSAQSAPRA
jgi:signal peptidase I